MKYHSDATINIFKFILLILNSFSLTDFMYRGT